MSHGFSVSDVAVIGSILLEIAFFIVLLVIAFRLGTAINLLRGVYYAAAEQVDEDKEWSSCRACDGAIYQGILHCPHCGLELNWSVAEDGGDEKS